MPRVPYFKAVSSTDVLITEPSEGSPGGLRFVEVRVPKGGEIRWAYIQFSAEDFGGEVTELWIRAALAGDALG